jgi:hypothetical protein
MGICVCSGTWEMACSSAHTLVPLPGKLVNLFAIVIVTHNSGPHSFNPQRQLFPCLGGCTPHEAGCHPRAPAAPGRCEAAGAVEPTRQADPSADSLPQPPPALPWRQEMRVGEMGARVALWSHFYKFLIMWERFSYYSLPIRSQTPKPTTATVQFQRVQRRQRMFLPYAF